MLKKQTFFSLNLSLDISHVVLSNKSSPTKKVSFEYIFEYHLYHRHIQLLSQLYQIKISKEETYQVLVNDEVGRDCNWIATVFFIIVEIKFLVLKKTFPARRF